MQNILFTYKELVADIQAKLKLNEKDAVVAHKKTSTGLLKALPPSFFFFLLAAVLAAQGSVPEPSHPE